MGITDEYEGSDIAQQDKLATKPRELSESYKIVAEFMEHVVGLDAERAQSRSIDASIRGLDYVTKESIRLIQDDISQLCEDFVRHSEGNEKIGYCTDILDAIVQNGYDSGLDTITTDLRGMDKRYLLFPQRICAQKERPLNLIVHADFCGLYTEDLSYVNLTIKGDVNNIVLLGTYGLSLHFHGDVGSYGTAHPSHTQFYFSDEENVNRFLYHAHFFDDYKKSTIKVYREFSDGKVEERKL